MKTKNFVLAGLAGGITDYLLGWLLYGILFMDYFGGEMPVNMTHIALGCLTFGMLMSYIYVKWAAIRTFSTGLQGGIVLGLIMGLMRNFFDASMQEVVDFQKFGVDVAISIVMAALVGGVVGAVNGALSKTED